MRGASPISTEPELASYGAAAQLSLAIAEQTSGC